MTTPEAPTLESVEKAIENITQKAFAACGTTQDARPFKKDRDTIRAHIAAQYQQMEKANRDALTEVTRLCKLLAESKAEVERLRFAAANLLDNLHGLTKLQEVQHRAPTWMKAIENSADRLRAIINPEHVSEAKHLEKGGE
jgi:hypothetical protein